MKKPGADSGSKRPARLGRGVVFAVGLFAIWAVWVGLTLIQGFVPITALIGDARHFAALVLRMADGEIPRVDFVTPLGLLSIWPIAAFVQLGHGLGTAFLLAQVSIGALLLPVLWWVGLTRFRRKRFADAVASGRFSKARKSRPLVLRRIGGFAGSRDCNRTALPGCARNEELHHWRA